MTRGQYLDTIDWIVDAIVMAEKHKAKNDEAAYGCARALHHLFTRCVPDDLSMCAAPGAT